VRVQKKYKKKMRLSCKKKKKKRHTNRQQQQQNVPVRKTVLFVRGISGGAMLAIGSTSVLLKHSNVGGFNVFWELRCGNNKTCSLRVTTFDARRCRQTSNSFRSCRAFGTQGRTWCTEFTRIGVTLAARWQTYCWSKPVARAVVAAANKRERVRECETMRERSGKVT